MRLHYLLELLLSLLYCSSYVILTDISSALGTGPTQETCIRHQFLLSLNRFWRKLGTWPNISNSQNEGFSQFSGTSPHNLHDSPVPCVEPLNKLLSSI